MFLLVCTILIGGSYIYWRYTIIDRKRLFFNSPFVVAIVGSLFILTISLVIVNTFSSAQRKEIIVLDEPDFAQPSRDTTLAGLREQTDPRFHYDLVLSTSEKGVTAFMDRLQAHYHLLAVDPDTIVSSIGHFGAGLVWFCRGKNEGALRLLEQISWKSMPNLHYLRGRIHARLESPELAEQEFLAELKVKNGKFESACSRLSEMYLTRGDYKSLSKLLENEELAQYFPEKVARTTWLRTWNLGKYVTAVGNRVWHHANVRGILAAIAISIVWLVYLKRLGIFRKQKISRLLLLFGAGMLSTFFVLTFNDVISLVTGWKLTGAFFNDLAYAILMIGMPEELTKIVPLLLLVAYRRKFEEPIDYLLLACASALGFACIENILYFENFTGGIIHGRAYFSAIGHMIDSSIVAYGFVLYRFRKVGANLSASVLFTFSLAAVAHGLYDFLLFQGMILLFFMYFIFIVQVWIIVINNCLNNSPVFKYQLSPRADRSKVFLALSLTAIFAFEYLVLGFSIGVAEANHQFYSNSGFALLLIIFFSSNLSSFNLVKGYWRDVYFSSREKRGYGTIGTGNQLTSWYFVNSIRAHNYVGFGVVLGADPHNRELSASLSGNYPGTIIDRRILYERKDPDPHWFVVQLEQPLPLPGIHSRYALIKLRDQNDSLTYQDDVQVYFRGIPDMNALTHAQPQKEEFAAYGWARVSFLSAETQRSIS